METERDQALGLGGDSGQGGSSLVRGALEGDGRSQSGGPVPKPGAEQCATKSAEGLFPSASCNTLTIHTYDLRMAPDSTKDMNSAERLHAYLALFGDSRRKRPQKDLLGIWDDLLGSHDRGELPELDVAKLVALVADVQTTAKVLELQG